MVCDGAGNTANYLRRVAMDIPLILVVFVIVFASRNYPTFRAHTDSPILRRTTIERYAPHRRTE